VTGPQLPTSRSELESGSAAASNKPNFRWVDVFHLISKEVIGRIGRVQKVIEKRTIGIGGNRQKKESECTRPSNRPARNLNDRL